MLTIYAITLFVSSALLFVVQPVAAKILLPLMGGTPVVWNTAMVFFQAMLLVGYAYAHILSRLIAPRRQLLVHLAMLVLIAAALPIGLPDTWVPDTTTNPVPWLIGALFVSVGAPFFAVSTSAPLLQHWFANTNHAAAHNPYFLYAVSNLGGLLALVGYPVLVEPWLTIAGQRWSWSGGYVLLAGLTTGCAYFVVRFGKEQARPQESVKVEARSGSASVIERPSLRARTHWLALAFVPSSLLLGVTSYLTTDIAAFPLLWIVPLALFLTTFVIVFARHPILSHARMVQVQPFLVIPLVAWFYWEFEAEIWVIFLIHLTAFFAITMVCHGELVRHRPSAEHLTEFYLWMSAGGILGGLFNALLAPLLFDSIVEYPLMIAVACLLRPRSDPLLAVVLRKGFLPLIGAVSLAAILVIVEIYSVDADILSQILALIIVASFCFAFAHRPVWFASAVSAVLVAGTSFWTKDSDMLFQARSYFGVYQVYRDEGFNILYHGTTEHGAQSLDQKKRLMPTTYYTASGPVGQVFDIIPPPAQGRAVAIIGLGAGTIACYGRKGEKWTYYEIDPVVERIARDAEFFTYLRDCPPNPKVVLGDGRISLADSPDTAYDMIFLDAFSSDSVPIHLITKEAVALYLRKLAEGGVIMFNVSNRHIDLRPVLADIAKSLNLAILWREDSEISDAEAEDKKDASDWIILARRRGDLHGLTRDERWQVPKGGPRSSVWTDDFSNVFGAIKWGGL